MGSTVLHLVDAGSANQGWVCRCGTWVPNGCVHTCPTFVSPTYPSPYAPQVPSLYKFGPCLGGNDHDFVVGNKYAICNQCEKVITFDSWVKRLVIWGKRFRHSF